jgi:hypothetical protein
MNSKLLSLDEMEIRVKFDAARAKYVVIYGESIFEKCTSCKGTGLVTGENYGGGPVWDCNSYCGDCDGYGGKFILGEVIFECNECKDKDKHEKFRCEKCRGSGVVDWLENLINKQIVLRPSYKPLTPDSRFWEEIR